MKNIFYKSKFFIAISFTFLFWSCSEYLDVDTDTDNPTVASINQLLTNIEIGVGSAGDFRVFSGNILQVYTHQFTAREEQDQYGAKADNILMNNDWNNEVV